MSLQIAKLANLVIANGETKSRWVRADKEFGDADSITLYNPTGSAFGTCNLEVSYDSNVLDATDGVLLQTAAGVDLVIPAAGKAIEYEALASVKAFRLKATVGVTGAQTMYVTKKYEG